MLIKWRTMAGSVGWTLKYGPSPSPNSLLIFFWMEAWLHFPVDFFCENFTLKVTSFERCLYEEACHEWSSCKLVGVCLHFCSFWIWVFLNAFRCGNLGIFSYSGWRCWKFEKIVIFHVSLVATGAEKWN